jgi:hypothetical protein
MNDDYLWDKSGKPDPEVQQLEEILGTLRYEHRVLEIPSQPIGRQRSYFPILAIAATVAFALVAGGLWLRAQSQKAQRTERATIVVPDKIKEDVPTPRIAQDGATFQKQKPKDTLAKAPRLNARNLVAGSVRHVKASPETGLTTKEREEALEAKGQLMVALRLASEKLNLAQRRTQSSSPPNLIRNQHKVG